MHKLTNSHAPNPQPLKVLYLQTTGHIGGTEMANFRVWRDRPSELDIDVCILNDDLGDVTQLYREHGYEPTHLWGNKRPITQSRRAFAKIANQTAYDLIHVFGLKNNLIARTTSLPKQTKLISGQRSIDPWRTPLQNWLDRVTNRRVDHYISNSKAAEKWLHDTFNIAQQQTTTIHTGIDPTPFIRPKSNRLRQALGIAADDFVVVVAANFVTAKAHDVLIDGMLSLKNNGVEFYLLLAGEGPTKNTVREHVQQAGLQEHVHFLGFRTDMPEVYANADLKILPTNWEGLPNAVLEAMAAGLPVIGSDVGGVGELIADKETGLLVSQNTGKQFALALSKLMVDKGLREQMGLAARQRVIEAFDPVKKMGELTAVYHSVAKIS